MVFCDKRKYRSAEYAVFCEAIGREAGRKEGVMEQAKATAIRMNKKGLSLADIAEAIDFNIETVKKSLMTRGDRSELY